MSRFQLALTVSDLDAAVEFYSKLFGAEPAKLRPGYANFALADPPLKLVLLEVGGARGQGAEGALNHLGVEVDSTDEVVTAAGRLNEGGLRTEVEQQTNCCHAVQDRVWVNDPDGAPWEVYTVLADAPVDSGIAGDGTCCIPEAIQAVSAAVGGARSASSSSTSSCC